jgi:hypothetical protein
MINEEKNKILREYSLGKGASLKDAYYSRDVHSYYFHYFRKTYVDYMKSYYQKAKALELLEYLKDVYEEDYNKGSQGLASHEQFIYDISRQKKI